MQKYRDLAYRGPLSFPYEWNDYDLFWQGFYQPFKGCLKGLLMNGQQVSDVAAYRVNSLRCSDNVEEGVYFGPSTSLNDSNYLKVIYYSNINIYIT